jgi:CRP-like cAMP-binding protein
LLHRLLDAATVSRTVGVMESLKLATEGTGALLAPALVGLFGIRPALILAGVPLPLTILISLPRLRLADRAAAARASLVWLLHRTTVFRSLDMASIEDVAARARRMELAPRTDVVREGEPGDDFYVIESGEAEVLLAGFRVARLTAGAGFGERAMLRSTTRNATVRTVTELTAFAIDRVGFLAAITGVAPDELDEVDLGRHGSERDLASAPLSEVLADIPLLHPLSAANLERLVDSATIEEWEPGTVLVREGELATEMFVILSGRARTTIGGEHVRDLLAGDTFGEIASIHRVARRATVAAAEPLRTCRLDISTLADIILA